MNNTDINNLLALLDKAEDLAGQFIGGYSERFFSAEEFHEVRITVGNTQSSKDTDTPVHDFFGFVQILIKVVINVPGTLLLSKRAVLDDVPVQPLIKRSELFVGKSRTEKLVSGEAEKVRSDPALARSHYVVAVQIAKARGAG